MKVIPAPGINVRDPVSLQLLPPEGKEVPASVYWMRRIKCGDVVLSLPFVLSKACPITDYDSGES